MTSTSYTSAGIAYDRAGPRGDLPVILIHAGVADRRMWDPLWPALTAERDVVRLDLRGYGESVTRPRGALCPVDDVLDTLNEVGIDRSHLVGASFGAGVAVEVALTRPEMVASLLLSGPGGSLIAEVTPDLRAFIEAERSTLARGDLDGAVEANLTWWVDGPGRDAGDVDSAVRDHVRQMQRRAFEVTADWDDIKERGLDPPALSSDLQISGYPPWSSWACSISTRSTTRHGAYSAGSPTYAASTGQTLPTYRRWSAPTTSSHYCGTG